MLRGRPIHSVVGNDRSINAKLFPILTPYIEFLLSRIPRFSKIRRPYAGIVGITCLLLLTSCNTNVKQPFNIGIVNLTPVLDPVFEGFKEGMTEMGYTDNENVVYVYEGATRSIEALDEAVAALLKADVDLILAISTPAAQAAKRSTLSNGVPVVFVPIFDPVAAGLVESLQQPGGNLTGVHWGIAENRRLEWLLRLAPNTHRIYIPFNPDDQSAVLALERIKEAAEMLDTTLVIVAARTPEEIEDAAVNVPADVDAILLLPDNLVATRGDDLLRISLERKIPYSVPSRELVDGGGLVSFGHSSPVSGKIAARIASQIIQGNSPGELPVETAEFFLTINLRTAEAIGLQIPEEILSQADTVIR